jgi:uncharacterized protein YfdQ (DUF2303 family)
MEDSRFIFNQGLAAGPIELITPKVLDDMAPGSIPYAIVPEGATKESLEEFLPRPARMKAEVYVATADSFISYVERFATPSTVVRYSNGNVRTGKAPKIEAVLDYHGASAIVRSTTESPKVERISQGDPAWRSHSVALTATCSEEFSLWVGSNAKRMSQDDFARFLEDRSLEITNPSGAEIYTLVGDFKATAAVAVNQAVQLKNGTVQVGYSNVVSGKSGSGTLEFPERMTLSMSIFYGELPEEFPVRLRFRIKDQRLEFWYEIENPVQLAQKAAEQIKRRIEHELNWRKGFAIPFFEVTQ